MVCILLFTEFFKKLPFGSFSKNAKIGGMNSSNSNLLKKQAI
jgi:hypothetical protein